LFSAQGGVAAAEEGGESRNLIKVKLLCENPAPTITIFM
jgi:hypothetical protein